MSGRPLVLAVAVIAAVAMSASTAVATTTEFDGDEAHLSDAFKRHLAYREYLASDVPEAERLVEYAHAPLCNVDSGVLESGVDGPCEPPNGTVNMQSCGDDEPVLPLWTRTRPAPSSDWTRWTMVISWICPDDLLPPFSERDFRSLTIASPEAHRQPATGDVLVNKPLIVYTEPDVERRFRTSLFGYGIDVVATPLEYTWDFGDGTELTTTSPGAPYPSFELTHDYRAPGAATVTLTTTWEGQYRVDEDPDGEWRDIDGTAVTAVALDPFEVVELRTRLTDD